MGYVSCTERGIDMKWLTKDYVRRQAQKSDEAALAVGIEHYDQMIAATAKEFKDAVEKKLVSIWSTHCGLCKRYVGSNAICPLKGYSCIGACVDEWLCLRDEWEAYKAGNNSWREVRKAMRAVRRKLKSARKTLPRNQ